MKEAAEDVDATFEDQQKVNKSAQNTSGIRAEGRNRCKKDTTPNVEGACEDILQCSMPSYHIGGFTAILQKKHKEC